MQTEGLSTWMLTFTPPESAPSGQFWLIYALIGGVRVKVRSGDKCTGCDQCSI